MTKIASEIEPRLKEHLVECFFFPVRVQAIFHGSDQ